MKVTIDGHEFPSINVRDWTYREADAVKRITGLRAGEILAEVMRGDAMVDLAFAVVGFMREKPDEDPDPLYDYASERIIVDFREDDDASPPAGAGGRKERAGKSPRKS